jgi:hypothetical protein
MPVMAVGNVRVGVPQPDVHVAMTVRFAGRVGRRVRVPMVFIVHMPMGVLHRLMLMFVLVPFGQMQPNANTHE